MVLTYAGSLTSNNVQVDPLTGSITVAAGTKTIFVGVMTRNTQPAISSVYNAATCNLVRRLTVGASDLTVWQLNDPATGANTLTIDVPGACYCAAAVIESDVYATVASSAVANGSSTTPSVVVPSAVGNVVLAFIQRATFSGACTWQAPATELDVNGTPGGDSTAGRGILYSGQEAGAASVTIDAVLGVSDAWTMMGLSLTEATGQGPLLGGRRNSLIL